MRRKDPSSTLQGTGCRGNCSWHLFSFHLRACAKSAMFKCGRDRAILEEVIEAVRRWAAFAEQAGLSKAQTEQIARAHCLQF
jgi:hypothetical protein